MDDWQKGDLALCVHGGDWIPGSASRRIPDQCSPVISSLFPRPGSNWTVDRVEYRHGADIAADCEAIDLIYLGLQGQPSDYLYDARHFRKIDAYEADAEDRATIDLLNDVPLVDAMLGDLCADALTIGTQP